MNAPDNMKTVLGMTADTVGKDLLSALVAELKLMPEPWQKMPKRKQNDILDRLRDRVAANVKMAVHLISASGRIVVNGELEQITIKGGAKAVINVSRGAESLHDFYDAQGTEVLIAWFPARYWQRLSAPALIASPASSLVERQGVRHEDLFD